MIFFSHFKCMTTNPGTLSKNYETLSFSKLPENMQKLIVRIGENMRKYEVCIRNELKERN